MAIYRASANPFLEEQARALHRRLKPYRRIQLRSLNRIEQSFAEHDRIVKAILAGHSLEAEQALWSM
nr:FCD domain-containing protein [Mesorhizobium sp.]